MQYIFPDSKKDALKSQILDLIITLAHNLIKMTRNYFWNGFFFYFFFKGSKGPQ